MVTSHRVGAALLTATALLSPAALAGCSSDGGKDTGGQSHAESPQDQLAQLKSTLDHASSVHIALKSSNVPSGQQGIISGDGVGKHPPAFKGTFKIQVKGVQADSQITAVNGKVWAQLPLVPGTHEIKVKDYHLPDPAVLMSPDQGITNLLPRTTGPTRGDDVRSGSDILHTINGKVPGQTIHDLFTIGDRNGTFDVKYGYGDSGELRTVELTGPFFDGSTSTYSLQLDQYNSQVEITPPQ